MKKNRTWRAAGLLLVLTLVTSCFVGGTFAKYTTTGGANDTARVAKFGVTVEGGGSLFAKNYVNLAGGNTPGAGANLTVESNSSDDVVAPGTKNAGAGLTFGVTGQPEVDVTIASTLTAQNIFLKAGSYAKMDKIELIADTYETGKYYTMDGNGAFTISNNVFADGTAYYELGEEVAVAAAYYPVQYTLTEGATAANTPGVTADSLTDETNGAAKKLAEKLGLTNAATDENGVTTYTGTAKSVAANKDLSTELNLANEKLSWEWKFETGADDIEKAQYNKQDTLLGDLMAYDAANPTYAIVLVETGTAGGSDTYTLLKANTDGIVTKNGAAVTTYAADAYACLKTGINLSVTVTQVD